jgi:hypothetical protein
VVEFSDWSESIVCLFLFGYFLLVTVGFRPVLDEELLPISAEHFVLTLKVLDLFIAIVAIRVSDFEQFVSELDDSELERFLLRFQVGILHLQLLYEAVRRKTLKGAVFLRGECRLQVGNFGLQSVELRMRLGKFH